MVPEHSAPKQHHPTEEVGVVRELFRETATADTDKRDTHPADDVSTPALTSTSAEALRSDGTLPRRAALIRITSDSDENAEVTAPSHSDTASASAEHTEVAAAASSNMGSSVSALADGVVAETQTGAVVAEPQTGAEPFLVVEINLHKNRSERLVCYEGETATQAADRFCQQHPISVKRRQRLVAILQTHLSV